MKASATLPRSAPIVNAPRADVPDAATEADSEADPDQDQRRALDQQLGNSRSG
jgi:hypothetical protein